MKINQIQTRRHARVLVLQALYAVRFFENDPETTIDKYLKEYARGKNWNFTLRLFQEIQSEYLDFEKIIQRHLTEKDIGRVALLDRIILEIALCEFLKYDDIPIEVTMNEAIELAKIYCADSSARFINGILDATVRELILEGLIKKTKKGLSKVEIDKKLP
jgi:N utilization substance protein B